MRIGFVLLGLLCLIASPVRAEPQIITFPGICDASAAVAVDDRRIIVADDEKRFLSIYDLQDPDNPKKVNIPLPDGEFDLEGAAVFAGRIVWILLRPDAGRIMPITLNGDIALRQDAAFAGAIFTRVECERQSF